VHRGVSKARGDPLAVGLLSALLPDFGQAIGTIGIRAMGSELSPCAHQMEAAAQQVAGGTHLRRRARGVGEHAPAQQRRQLVGIDLGVVGVAPLDGFPREGMPQDEGHAFLGTELGQPLPGEETLDRHDQAVTIRRHRRKKWCRRGLHMAVYKNLSTVAQDAHVHGAGVPVDAPGNAVWLGGEAPEVSASS
jgi:hypothetical protein